VFGWLVGQVVAATVGMLGVQVFSMPVFVFSETMTSTHQVFSMPVFDFSETMTSTYQVFSVPVFVFSETMTSTYPVFSISNSTGCKFQIGGEDVFQQLQGRKGRFVKTPKCVFWQFCFREKEFSTIPKTEKGVFRKSNWAGKGVAPASIRVSCAPAAGGPAGAQERKPSGWAVPTEKTVGMGRPDRSAPKN